MNKRIFCFWTGDNPIPKNRLLALNSLTNSNLKVTFIDKNNLSNWILPTFQLHPAYEYLSAIHRADYLRVYFMHHYGGGYSDIKYLSSSWLPSWYELNNTDKFAVGYKEIGPKGVAIVPSLRYIHLLINWEKLIGNCAYIFKPDTEFTIEWIDNTHKLLDSKLFNLKLNPAKLPEDYYGKLINGIKSQYPIRWSEMLGNIFHPLCLKYKDRLIYSLPRPDFHINYDV